MKIGTIGTSFITSWFIQSLNDVVNCRCVAVYSRSESKAIKLAKQFQIEKIYIDVKLMMEDEEIDTVYIALPNSLHFSYAKFALEKNKNVILEKPFVSNARECEILMQIARESHLFLFEAITTRYLPNLSFIKTQLPRLGKIQLVECNMSQRSRKYDELLNGKKPNVFNPQYSGGALMDINLYNIQFIVELFGIPNDLIYQANIYKRIDTSGILIMRYDCLNVVSVGCKDANGHNFIQIQGDNGFVYIDSAACVLRKVRVQIDNEAEEVYTYQDREFTHYYYLCRFNEIIENQDYNACYAELEKTLNVMRVLDKARASAGIYFPNDVR